MSSIPFLPGNTFQDVKVCISLSLWDTICIAASHSNVQKHDFRKPHSLGYKNGYPTQITPKLGIGLTTIEVNQLPSPEQLLNEAGNSPDITYGDKRFHKQLQAPRFVPAHVAFDKVVCWYI